MKQLNTLSVWPLLVCLFMNVPLMPCTGIFLKTTDGTYIHARTMEFGADMQSNILFIPRNYHLEGVAPSNKAEGLAWTSIYACIGANALNTTNFLDGVNEKGLAGGLFYFPDFAQYQDVTPENYKKSLPVWQLLTWILTSFATVDEAERAVRTIYVSKTAFPQMGQVVPAHMIVHDTTGKSIVIEYLNGALNVYDNPLGVITNAPSFDWHMTNLRNYLTLTPLNAPDKKVHGVTLRQLGQGSGMLGLPGDFTPPSRFVRAVAFSQTTRPGTSSLDGIYQAFHILNNFDIPKGVVVDADGNGDYTQWTNATDMKNKIFYFRAYDNFQLHKIELMALNLESTTTSIFPLQQKDTVVDITPKK